ncbi:MAG: TetR family transcriptional regulator [Saprospiraceae bacterium]|nr:MAG: TetR family transcriptional regulator [Saprospiraceae bacterium]
MEASKSKKQTILEAAAELFRDRGYVATSMRDLADAVQLKASSLYNHISGKEEILQTICFQNANRFLAGMKEIEKRPINNTDKVKALIHLHIQIATEDFTSITAFNDEWRHLSDPELSRFKELRRDYELRFKSIIQAGIDAGEFVSVDTTIALFTIISAVRWIYDWFKPNRAISMDQLEEQIERILLGGLGVKGV